MIFFLFLIAVVAVVFAINRGQRQRFLQQWQTAAHHFDDMACDTGGTVSGYPALYGHIEGRRIDVAPFFHREMGSSTSRMTGYRVSRERPIDLPRAAINSLSRHFAKVEIDDRRIFCGTHGVENSAIKLIAGINHIAAALRSADIEHEQKTLDTLEKSRATIEEKPPAPPPLANREETPAAKAEETPASPSTRPEEQPAQEQPAQEQQKEDEAAAPWQADAIAEPELAPEPPAEPAVSEIASPSEEPVEPPLTQAARDLFASGHNRFQTTRLFSSDYAEREVTGFGKLLRIDTFANDRVFGRGPGVVAEIEINCPEPAVEEPEEEDVVVSVVNPSPSRITASVELDFDEEDTTAGEVARSMRERAGQTVEVCGTLIHCDVFNAKLYLNESIVA